MKARVLLSCAIMALSPVMMGMATAASHRQDDHEALRSLSNKVEAAVNAGALDMLGTLLAEEFTIIMPDQERITDRVALVAYWDEMFNREDSPVRDMRTEIRAEKLTHFIGANAGYSYGTNRDIYTLENKRTIAIESTWSAILVKEDGHWKIKLAHVGVDFLDNPVLEAQKMSWFERLMVTLHLRRMPGETTEE